MGNDLSTFLLFQDKLVFVQHHSLHSQNGFCPTVLICSPPDLSSLFMGISPHLPPRLAFCFIVHPNLFEQSLYSNTYFSSNFVYPRRVATIYSVLFENSDTFFYIFNFKISSPIYLFKYIIHFCLQSFCNFLFPLGLFFFAYICFLLILPIF